MKLEKYTLDILFFTIFIIALIASLIYSNLISFQFILLCGLVISGLYFGRQKSLFSPDKLFLSYSSLLLITLYHLISDRGFSSDFIKSQNFYDDFDFLLNKLVTYLILSYLSFILGFNLFVSKCSFSLKIIPHFEMKIILAMSNLYIFMGLLNFTFNIFLFSGGDIISYMNNVSIRTEQFSEKGTTVGYLLLYIASNLYVYMYCRGYVSLKSVLLVVSSAVIVKFSTGRIIGTLILCISYLLIFYYINYNFYAKNTNKIIIYCAGISSVSVLLYLFRYVSSIGDESINYVEAILGLLNLNDLTHFIVEKGNTPNLYVLLKIIDSWERECDYMYGVSLLMPIFHFIPSSIIDSSQYVPSIILKNHWYYNLEGGNIPPTGFGELYMNFGFFSAIVFMFIFGLCCAFLHNKLIKSGSIWLLIIYSNISLSFIMIYPKGEFDNMSFWYFIPTLSTMFLIWSIKCLRRS